MKTHNATPRQRNRRRLLASTVGAVVMLVGALATPAGGLATPAEAGAGAEHPAVSAWVRHHAVRLDTIEPTAPLRDLAALRQSVGDAQIVGLGESVHGAAEEITLKHRALRFLVERRGFRSVAWEEDWTMGLRIDRYIRTGKGDLGTLMRQASSQWQSHEVADVLRWLRDYNRGRADKVRFFGVEYYLTRRLAYDAVRAYVARTAPGQLPRLRRHLRPIRPDTANVQQHYEWYVSVSNKRPYVRHARKIYRIVEDLPHRAGPLAYEIAVHHARQIRSFYVHYALPFGESLVYRDARAAQNLRWWHRLSGDKVAYWAASPHTANAPRLRMVVPPYPDMRFPSAGSYLRDWYGTRYLSIGFTFDHGTVSLRPGETAEMPPPKADWFEEPFGDVRCGQFLLDLRADAPPPVRSWLHGPVTTRGLPDAGPDSYLAGGSLAQWFDVIIHRQHVTPVRPT